MEQSQLGLEPRVAQGLSYELFEVRRTVRTIQQRTSFLEQLLQLHGDRAARPRQFRNGSHVHHLVQQRLDGQARVPVEVHRLGFRVVSTESADAFVRVQVVSNDDLDPTAQFSQLGRDVPNTSVGRIELQGAERHWQVALFQLPDRRRVQLCIQIEYVFRLPCPDFQDFSSDEVGSRDGLKVKFRQSAGYVALRSSFSGLHPKFFLHRLRHRGRRHPVGYHSVSGLGVLTLQVTNFDVGLFRQVCRSPLQRKLRTFTGHATEKLPLLRGDSLVASGQSTTLGFQCGLILEAKIFQGGIGHDKVQCVDGALELGEVGTSVSRTGLPSLTRLDRTGGGQS